MAVKFAPAKPTSLDGHVQAVDCLRSLAHPHRLRKIPMQLRDEHTVGALAEACGFPSHMASEHIGKMKDRGLLTAARRGRQIFYQVSVPHLANIMACVEARFR